MPPRVDQDFAVLEHDGNFFQLHADHTYQDNPLPETLEGPITGAAALNCGSTKETLIRVKAAQRKTATTCFVPASIVLTV